MANKKEYEIIINGVTEATQNVETLGDALNRLNVNVETHSEGIKKSSSSMDELAKTELKITQYNEEYNRALQTNKAVLADKNKAIKEELDLENANIIVQENAQNTYREKQTLLTALGKVIKNTNAQTDEEKEKLNNLKSQYASLNQELKNFDAELGNHQRNVGDYGQATKNLKQELRGMQDEMANLLAQGIQKTDPAFQALAAKAGVLRDAMQDAREEVNRFASDTKKLDDVVNVAQSATAAFQLYSGAMNAFGIESREATKAIQELMGVMSIVQSLQTLSNALQNGSATARLLSMASKALKLDLIAQDAAAIATTKSQEGLTVAQKAGTIATKTLSMAIKAIPLMFVIGLVTTLITHWEDLVGWFDKTFPSLKKVGGAMNGLKGVCMGLGKAIINWVVNPIKTMADVIQKVLKGDFKGAMEAVGEGIKNQFVGTAKAFKEGFQDQVERGLDEIAKKDAETNNKLLDHQMKMLEAKKGKDAKYTKEYQALMQKKYENDKKMAKGNAEELQKIEWERQEYVANLEREQTENAERENQNRLKNSKKAFNQEKKDLQARLKYQIEVESLERLLHKKTDDLNLQSFTDSMKYRKKVYEIGARDAKRTIEQLSKEYVQYVGWSGEEAEKKVSDANAKILLLISDMYDEGLKENIENIYSDIAKDFPLIFRTVVEHADDLVPVGLDVDLLTKKFSLLVNEIDRMKDINVEVDEDYIEGLVNQLDLVQALIRKVKVVGETELKSIDEQLEMNKEALAKLEASSLSSEKDILDLKKNILELAHHRVLLEAEIENSVQRISKESATALLTYYDAVKEKEKKVHEELVNQQLELFDKANEKNKATIDSLISELKRVNKIPIIDPTDRLIHPKKAKEAQQKWRVLNKELYNTLKQTLKEEDAQNALYLALVKEKYGEDSKEFIEACTRKKEEHAKMLKQMEMAARAAKIDPQTGEEREEKTGIAGVGQKIKDALDPNIDWNEFWWNPDAPTWDNIGDIYDKLDEAVFSPINDAFSMMLEFQIEEAQEALDKATEMHDKSVEAVESSKSRLDEINNQMSSANSAQLAELKAKQADEMLLLAQREAEEKRLAKEKQKRQEELDKKEKQKKKLELRAQLVEAIANVAMGVTKTLGSYPWPVNAIFAALTAAMGAIQISTIQKQLSKLEDGGLLKGRSHANGGMRIQGTNIEVEGGEYVVNKKSTKKYLPLLQAINEEGRTASYKKPIASHQMMKYASGGEINYQRIDNNLGTLDTNKVIQSSIGEIEMHPVVSVVDINKGQKNLTQVRQMAGSTRK